MFIETKSIRRAGLSKRRKRARHVGPDELGHFYANLARSREEPQVRLIRVDDLPRHGKAMTHAERRVLVLRVRGSYRYVHNAVYRAEGPLVYTAALLAAWAPANTEFPSGAFSRPKQDTPVLQL
jgi:hypothetical protein